MPCREIVRWTTVVTLGESVSLRRVGCPGRKAASVSVDQHSNECGKFISRLLRVMSSPSFVPNFLCNLRPSARAKEAQASFHFESMISLQ